MHGELYNYVSTAKTSSSRFGAGEKGWGEEREKENGEERTRMEREGGETGKGGREGKIE